MSRCASECARSPPLASAPDDSPPHEAARRWLRRGPERASEPPASGPCSTVWVSSHGARIPSGATGWRQTSGGRRTSCRVDRAARTLHPAYVDPAGLGASPPGRRPAAALDHPRGRHRTGPTSTVPLPLTERGRAATLDNRDIRVGTDIGDRAYLKEGATDGKPK